MAQPQRIVDIAGQLSEMEASLRSALSVRTLMEMTLIRCARLAKTVSMDELIRRLTALKDQVIRRLAAAAPKGPVAAPAAQPERAAPSVPAPAPSAPPPPSALPPEPEVPVAEDPYADAEDESEPYFEEPPPNAFVPAPETPPAQPLKTSDGKYADEILNLTLRLFGGKVIF